MRNFSILFAILYVFSACTPTPTYNPERTYKSIEKSLTAKLMLATDSTVIELSGIIETRHMIHEESGWVAIPYIWNLEITGGEQEVALSVSKKTDLFL